MGSIDWTKEWRQKQYEVRLVDYWLLVNFAAEITCSFGQSAVVCSLSPQYLQRSSTILRACSSAVSFPSRPKRCEYGWDVEVEGSGDEDFDELADIVDAAEW